MIDKNIASFGLYGTYADFRNGIRSFSTEGFSDANISVLMPKQVGSKDLPSARAAESAEGVSPDGDSGSANDHALGWFTAIGVLSVPGVGPFLAAGPIVAAFEGTESVGVARGIAGALTALGILDFEARRLERHIWNGQIFLSVDCDGSDRAKRALGILESSGASDISTTNAGSAAYSSKDQPLPRGETGRVV